VPDAADGRGNTSLTWRSEPLLVHIHPYSPEDPHWTVEIERSARYTILIADISPYLSATRAVTYISAPTGVRNHFHSQCKSKLWHKRSLLVDMQLTTLLRHALFISISWKCGEDLDERHQSSLAALRFLVHKANGPNINIIYDHFSIATACLLRKPL
jgi:hypothetical protein